MVRRPPRTGWRSHTRAAAKISPIYGLAHLVPQTQRFSVWPEKIYLAHALDHPRYGESDGLWHAPVRTVGG